MLIIALYVNVVHIVLDKLLNIFHHTKLFLVVLASEIVFSNYVFASIALFMNISHPSYHLYAVMIPLRL